MRFAVIGYGRSGKAVVDYLSRQGESCYVFDEGNPEAENKENVHYFFGNEAKNFYKFGFDTVVVSPGVSRDHSFIRYAINNKERVIGEIEFGYEIVKCPIIAITGTNGKTTCAHLVEKMLCASGFRAKACGNIGFPFTTAASEDNWDFLVVEVSSFQLEFIDKFKPYIAVILNVSKDHLCRYEDLRDYERVKLKIFTNQDENDCAVYNCDLYDMEMTNPLPRIAPFSQRCLPLGGAQIKRDRVFLSINGDRIVIDHTRLFGEHNMENIAAASCASLTCGANINVIKEVAMTTETLAHRLEYVGEIDDVKFYNDSKSTNINAVKNAVVAFDKPIILILGGKHKGVSFAELVPLLKEKAKMVIVFGEDRKRIDEELKGVFAVPALDIAGAISGAFAFAAKGEIILFSPGGSSFDQYENFEERGEDFKRKFARFKKKYESV